LPLLVAYILAAAGHIKSLDLLGNTMLVEVLAIVKTVEIWMTQSALFDMKVTVLRTICIA
jgi:hypothetical protein